MMLFERAGRGRAARDLAVKRFGAVSGGVGWLGRLGIATGAFAATALGGSLASAEPLTRDTVRPLLIADVNALQANRYFLQSMLAFNSTPFTLGYSTQQARVQFERIDGQVVTGALMKDQLVASLGFGRPATGFAGYGVLNFAGATASDFPRMPLMGNYNSINIRATHAAVFAAVGLAYRGWVLQMGWTYNELRVHSDQYGRLTYCGDEGYCPDMGYPTRPGAPNPVYLNTNTTSASSRMLTLEQKEGFSVGALIAPLRDAGRDKVATTTLAALRLIAQPKFVSDLVGTKTLFGLGLNTYARQLDYYGDTVKAVADASRVGQAPPVRSSGIVEIPLIADNIVGTGVGARIVGQVSPTVTPRLAEVSYLLTGDEDSTFVPTAAARLKAFRRADHVEGAADLCAGFFWVTSRSNEQQQGRGLSLFATYTYNSPDASNFIPLPGAHVMGAQVVWGNPAALAPPVPAVRVPRSARYQEGGES